MKNASLIILVALLAGCAHLGSGLQKAGNSLTDTGAGVMMASGIAGPPGIVVGAIIGMPLYGLGSIAHGIGSAAGGSVNRTWWN